MQQSTTATTTAVNYNNNNEQLDENYNFDRRQRILLQRKVIDFNSSITYYISNRVYGRHGIERPIHSLPSIDYVNKQYVTLHNNQYSNVYYGHNYPEQGDTYGTRFIASSNNITKSSQQCGVWIRHGNRLCVGSGSGEFVLWNGITYGLDTMLTAHENSSVRALAWYGKYKYKLIDYNILMIITIIAI